MGEYTFRKALMKDEDMDKIKDMEFKQVLAFFRKSHIGYA